VDSQGSANSQGGGFDFPESADPLTVFVATPVASYCYLFEALLWMGFQRFPLGYPGESGADVRWENDFEDIEPAVEWEPANDEECHGAGLEPNPEYAVFATGDHISAPENIEKLLRLDLQAADREKLERDLAEAKEHYAKRDVWERKFEQFLDLHKSRLFVALREGKISAVGKALPPDAYDSFPGDLSSEDFWAWSRAGWTPIAAANWLSTGIDWEHSSARGTSADHALILISTMSLMANFPSEPQSGVEARRVGGAYLINEQGKLRHETKRGRPSFDWDELHLELAKRLTSNALPAKQEALIADMQAWCHVRWGRSVGRSTLLGKISPYYATFMRQSEMVGR
jgi:hypothetical protein